MVMEPRRNIGYICDDCIPERFPRAGLFPPNEVKKASHVDSDPLRPESPPLGTEVFIAFGKIEELGKF